MTEETTLNVVTFEDYENFVTQLASKDSMKDFNAKLGTGGLGLAGEAGEIAQLTFGVLEDYVPWSMEIRDKYIKELGDVMWYTAFVARNVLEIGLKDLVEYPPAEILAGDPTSNLRGASGMLCGVTALIADTTKKLLFHGMPWDDNVKQKMITSLAQVYWTASFFADNVLGCHLDEVIEANVEKLSARYKSLKFTTEEFMKKEEGQAE